MSMQDWIHKYPGVPALIQGDDDPLDYTVEEERSVHGAREHATWAALPSSIDTERRGVQWRVPRVITSAVVAVFHALLQGVP